MWLTSYLKYETKTPDTWITRFGLYNIKGTLTHIHLTFFCFQHWALTHSGTPCFSFLQFQKTRDICYLPPP